MKLAVYNLENLFNRARVMNQDDWAAGKETLNNYSELNKLLGEANYTAARKTRMVELLEALGLGRNDKSEFVILRQNRGNLVKRPRTGGIEIVAEGRADWVGSLELIPAPINHVSVLNTARVIKEVGADVLGLVEAESRPALGMFFKAMLPEVGGTAYPNYMIIDGNDERGIDVGIATADGYSLDYMISHVNDSDSSGKTIFSRDCPEYAISTPNGAKILVLVNHYKSKGFGSAADSNRKRKAQATRTKEIYEARRAENWDLIAVIGDLNDTPDSDPLSPLIQNTDLQDISTHPRFDNGGHPGTYGSALASNKIDYLLLSPGLFNHVTTGGIFRKGMWPGVRPAKWDVFPELTRPVEAASDHACVWVDLNL